MNQKHKLNRILGVTGWSRRKMAQLLNVSDRAVWAWAKGASKPRGGHVEKIDWLYTELVEPLICEIEQRADAAEKTLLEAKIDGLDEDNVCR